jgi:hypothetical protein
MKPIVVLGMAQPYPGYDYEQITIVASRILDTIVAFGQTRHNTNHPAGTVRCGTAIIIKNCIKHHQLNSYRQNFLQATSVSLEDSVGLLNVFTKEHSKARTIRGIL